MSTFPKTKQDAELAARRTGPGTLAKKGKPMDKDEAKAAVMRLMRAECACGIPGVKEPCFACEMSAGLDVLVHAALADTLGLLERLAKQGDDPVFKGIQVNYCSATESYIYLQYTPSRGLFAAYTAYISRDEAQKLLAGEEEI